MMFSVNSSTSGEPGKKPIKQFEKFQKRNRQCLPSKKNVFYPNPFFGLFSPFFRASGSWCVMPIAWYSRQLLGRPLLTKSLTGSFLYTAGDLLCQKIDGTLEREGWQTKRTLKMTFYGAFLFAPASHFWYSKILPQRIPGTSRPAVIKKLLWDQFIFAPIVNAIFLAYSVVTNGGGPREVTRKFRDDYLRIMAVNCAAWPPAMAINFKFVPVQYQVLYVNFGVIFWSAFLSYNVNRKQNVQQQYS